MIQLRVLSGKMAGTEIVARRFPFRVGRSAAAELRLQAAGVWDRHFDVECRYPVGWELSSHANAVTRVNGRRVERSLLRNGDVIELGSVKLQFWLSPVRQASLRAREWGTWLGLAALTAFQVGVIRWLSQ